MNRLSLLTVGTALFVLCGTAHAQVVITSAPTPGTPGMPGLTGGFYFTNGDPMTTVSLAQAYMASHPTTGTFLSTEAGMTGSSNGFGYFTGDGGSAADFLQPGGDGASYVGPTTTLDDGLFDFKGYLDVTSPGTLPFYTYADDGSAIFIAGQQVINNDGVHVETRVDGSATFAQAGLYPIEVVYFNHVTPGYVGTGGLQAGFGGAHLYQLAAAPELSGEAGFAVGLLGLGLLALRARRREAIRQL